MYVHVKFYTHSRFYVKLLRDTHIYFRFVSLTEPNTIRFRFAHLLNNGEKLKA